MKSIGIIFLAMLLATATFGGGINPIYFKKDELGALNSVDLQKFDELYRYAEQEGKIHVFIDVKRPGETLEYDVPKRADQGRYFAKTKRAILKDLGSSVIGYTDRDPMMPGMSLDMRPDALLMILNDSRIPTFTIIKNRWSETTIAKTPAADSTLPNCDSSIKVLEKPPFQYPRIELSTVTDGYVFLAFTIQKDGSVSDISILEAEPPRIFNRSAMRWLSRWRFSKPATPCRAIERIEYELE